eukprot:7008996-Prymnesium_polylepis.2
MVLSCSVIAHCFAEGIAVAVNVDYGSLELVEMMLVNNRGLGGFNSAVHAALQATLTTKHCWVIDCAGEQSVVGARGELHLRRTVIQYCVSGSDVAVAAVQVAQGSHLSAIESCISNCTVHLTAGKQSNAMAGGIAILSGAHVVLRSTNISDCVNQNQLCTTAGSDLACGGALAIENAGHLDASVVTVTPVCSELAAGRYAIGAPIGQPIFVRGLKISLPRACSAAKFAANLIRDPTVLPSCGSEPSPCGVNAFYFLEEALPSDSVSMPQLSTPSCRCDSPNRPAADVCCGRPIPADV